jgi:hypothetical protein
MRVTAVLQIHETRWGTVFFEENGPEFLKIPG